MNGKFKLLMTLVFLYDNIQIFEIVTQKIIKIFTFLC